MVMTAKLLHGQGFVTQDFAELNVSTTLCNEWANATEMKDATLLSVQTTTKRSGDAALGANKADTSPTPQGHYIVLGFTAGLDGFDNYGLTIVFRVDTCPAAVAWLRGSAGTTPPGFNFVASGAGYKLRMVDDWTGTLWDSSVLTLGEWYILQLRFWKLGTYYWYLEPIVRDDAGAVVDAPGTFASQNMVDQAALTSWTIGIISPITGACDFYIDGWVWTTGGAYPPPNPKWTSAMRPDSVGTYNSWTSSVPDDKWLDVDETQAWLGTGDYVSTLTSGARQSFADSGGCGVPVGQNVLFVKQYVYCKVTTPSSTYAIQLMRLGGDTGASSGITSAAYRYGAVQTEKDPAGNDWTIANADVVQWEVQALIGTTRRYWSYASGEVCYGDDSTDEYPRLKKGKVMP